MHSLTGLPLTAVKIRDGFWKERIDRVAQDAVPYQWNALNDKVPGVPPSGAIDNFRAVAGASTGDAQGMVFQDSDVGKWIEAAAYSLATHPDPDLERKIDELVRLIGRAQQPDGYINTYITLTRPDQRWANLGQGHELYTAGHLIEAAVAYHATTGKREMLDLVCRFADYIDEVFGPEDGKLHTYDGHPEVEMALYRLAGVTGEARYARLADYFIDIRGSIADFYHGRAPKPGMTDDSRWFRNDYYNAHVPARELRDAEGHAVRAVYLYSAMADQYARSGDPELLAALRELWRSVVERRMYVTAAIGSQARGERFTVDYDLPSDAAYAETCASVGLVFWAWRMSLIDNDARYADVIELAAYNGALGGMSLDGRSYHYVNALEVTPKVAEYRIDFDHVETKRRGWFECACCPTNIARLIASIGGYLISTDERSVWIHQYVGSGAELAVQGTCLRLETASGFPWDGYVRISLAPESPLAFALHLRIPGWCEQYEVRVNGEKRADVGLDRGYLRIERVWTGGDVVEIVMGMTPRLLRANPSVPELAGKVAIRRGPIVYCVEDTDNGADLHQLVVEPEVPVRDLRDDALVAGSVVLNVSGYRDAQPVSEGALYDPYRPDSLSECTIRAIPYYQRGNRDGAQEMRVWLRVRQ
ncbi:MAG: glycoside hydrolase family 127 protein [Spirochaetota bacterium]